MNRITRCVVAFVVALATLMAGAAVISTPAQAANHVDRAVKIALDKGLTFGVQIPLAESKYIKTLGDTAVTVNNGNGGSVGVVLPDQAEVHALQEKGAVRVLVPIASRSDSHKLDFPMALPLGTVLRVASNGSVNMVLGRKAIGHIAKPWAVDALGNSVATSYTVRGNVLTQRVQAVAPTAYPIVADPLVRLVDGIFTSSWYLSKTVVKIIYLFVRKYTARWQHVVPATIAAGFGIACSFFMTGPAAAACAAAGGLAAYYTMDQFRRAYVRNECIRIVVLRRNRAIPINVLPDTSRYCTRW